MKVSVIVPVLNVEPQAADTLRRIASVREHLDLEIVVVVDVPDALREPEVRAANDAVAASVGARTIYRVGTRGFGSAIRAGFAAATGDVLIPMMADACDEPADIPAMVQTLGRGYDVVAGSRYVRGGGIVGNTPKQRLSRVYSVLIRLAGGPPVNDVSNAFKAYRREVVEAVRSDAASFDISVELTLKAYAAGFRIGEVPTVWTNRQAGRSNFTFTNELRRYGRWLALAARTRRSPARRPEPAPLKETA